MQRYVFDNAGNCLSFYSLGPSKAKSFYAYVLVSKWGKKPRYMTHIYVVWVLNYGKNK